ncbi:GNAT family N-acetyltransferase [Salinarimonas ramus]|uniref:N-acetyltransferase domain-containing protein n=1 Tax=Salinarimonas ramus TaxID=690164 RepID=A0A917Q661_9HYPH|nr:GNAT family N-acetyltransferase [Salinarimonas ramus]GGK28519.1 hypothetical protein GCM10011322_13700 [Salinarimonas ramus]
MENSVTITAARSPDDFLNVRDLCDGFLSWLRERYATETWLIDAYYAPDKWAATLDSLPEVHAPPRGEILLARLGGRTIGCVMMRPLDGRACEMKRLFVRSDARGSGAGRLLCEQLLRLSFERGYEVMRLDTGVYHDEAIRLYMALGFRMRDAYYDVPPRVAELLHFMEADLTSAAQTRQRSSHTA